jgi:EAL domain-containing protein (putative c-di-GMP-specific phosphodiesterase class I)
MLPVLKKPFETSAITRIMQELKLGHAAPMAARIGLDEALRKGWIEFWHQPKIDLRKKQLAGAEAFARARHPQYGILPPGAFMPGATESELIALSELALASVLKAGLNFAKLGINLRFAVNIPVNALVKLSIPDIVRAHRAQIDNWPGLIIDITEEQIVTDLALATDMTKRLAHVNVKLAIDDFGRGYSSLARLKELPFAELKLDRTFVSDCGTDKVNAPLCKTVIDLAHNFGSAAVAIGIEKASDALALTSMGCDLGQGFLLGQPMPEERFLSLLRQRAAGQGRPKAAPAARSDHHLPSVRPGIAALESEIIGIGDHPACRRLRLRQLIRNAVALRIGDRLLLGVELEANLLAHVARAGPPHQRLDLTRLLRLVVEHPFLGLGGAGLHRSLRRFVDSCGHGMRRLERSIDRDAPPPAGLVGAAGFEPAT